MCNLALLLTIAFLPYPTGVFGRALVQGSGTEVAAVFYSATMAVNALCVGRPLALRIDEAASIGPDVPRIAARVGQNRACR